MPKAGDVWLVNYPYITPGNMKKIRPAIIRQVDEENNMVIVQKLTTKYHKGNREFRNNKMKKKTFVLGLILLALLLISILLFATDIVELPYALTRTSMYKRFDAKFTAVFDDSSSGSILSDRGWSRIVENPEYKKIFNMLKKLKYYHLGYNNYFE